MSVAPESGNRASSQWKVRKGWFQGHGADKANTVFGTPPGSFDWPVPISQLRSVGRALCTAAHFAPVIALDREVMPNPQSCPQLMTKHWSSQLCGTVYTPGLLVGSGCMQQVTGCNSVLAQQLLHPTLPHPAHRPLLLSAPLVNHPIQNPGLRLCLFVGKRTCDTS